MGSTGIIISWIDKSPVTGTITYTPSTPTSGNVQAEISFNKTGVTVIGGVPSLSGEVARSAGGVIATFTGDASFTFTYQDSYGNTGSTTATVDWIDKTSPTCAISYTPPTNTSGDVVASLTGCSEAITGTIFSSTFTGDGSFTFNFTDLVGNTGSSVATVDWIDKTVPVAIHLTYNPSSYTNTGVEVTLETSEWVYLPTGWSGSATGTIFTKIYTNNTTGTVTFYDHVYNQ
jgi:hypothetical protein